MYNVMGPCTAAMQLNPIPVVTCDHPFILHL